MTMSPDELLAIARANGIPLTESQAAEAAAAGARYTAVVAVQLPRPATQLDRGRKVGPEPIVTRTNAGQLPEVTVSNGRFSCTWPALDVIHATDEQLRDAWAHYLGLHPAEAQR